MIFALRCSSRLPPAAGLAYLNLTVRRPPALVFRPVKPASKAFSVSILITKLIALYSPAVMQSLGQLMIDALKFCGAGSMPLRVI